jgi:hypothetical protein
MYIYVNSSLVNQMQCSFLGSKKITWRVIEFTNHEKKMPNARKNSGGIGLDSD